MTEGLARRAPSPYDVEYPKALGGLISNLAVLEFCIRTTLYLLDTPRDERLAPSNFQVANLNQGQELPETWLTTWEYFKPLITEYNGRCERLNRPGIDPGIGELRNALAHSSLIAASPEEPVTLIRYDRPREGRVRVMEKQVMTLPWLNEQSRRVVAAFMTVYQHLNELR